MLVASTAVSKTARSGSNPDGPAKEGFRRVVAKFFLGVSLKDLTAERMNLFHSRSKGKRGEAGLPHKKVS